MKNLYTIGIAAHELNKTKDMNDHKSQLSMTTQVNQSSIRQM